METHSLTQKKDQGAKKCKAQFELYLLQEERIKALEA